MASRLARFAACTSEYPSGSAPKGFALGARAGGMAPQAQASPTIQASPTTFLVHHLADRVLSPRIHRPVQVFPCAVAPRCSPLPVCLSLMGPSTHVGAQPHVQSRSYAAGASWLCECARKLLASRAAGARALRAPALLTPEVSLPEWLRGWT